MCQTTTCRSDGSDLQPEHNSQDLRTGFAHVLCTANWCHCCLSWKRWQPDICRSARLCCFAAASQAFVLGALQRCHVAVAGQALCLQCTS